MPIKYHIPSLGEPVELDPYNIYARSYNEMHTAYIYSSVKYKPKVTNLFSCSN